MWIILGVQAALFIAWAVEAFRILFHLTRRGRATSGKLYPGPVTFVTAASGWLGDPAFVAQRWRFLILTVLVLGLSVAVFLVGPLPA